MQDDYLRPMAVVLTNAVKRVFEARGVEFTSRPTLIKKTIVEFKKRMRIFGMEKFSSPTFVSSVNYYLSAREMEEKKTRGVIVLYIEQDYLPALLQLLQYPAVDDEDDEALKDACGAVCNLVAGQFKTDLALMGYYELEMSHFSSYRNTSDDGVDFYPKITDKFEISFFIKGEKRLVAEISMGPVPRVKQPEDKAARQDKR